MFNLLKATAVGSMLLLAGCAGMPSMLTMQGQVQSFTAKDVASAAAIAKAGNDGMGMICFGSVTMGMQASGGEVGVATALESVRVCQGIIPVGLIP